MSEAGIAAGTRRIEAIAGAENIRHYDSLQRDKLQMAIQTKLKVRNAIADELRQLGVAVGVASPESFASDRDVIDDIKALEKELAQRKSAMAGEQSVDLLTQFKASAKGKVLIQRVAGADIPMLKELADTLCNSHPDGVVVLGSVTGDSGHWVVKSGAQYQSDWTAPKIIAELTQISGGKGGGRPNLAQAGGADPVTMESAMRHMESVLLA